MKIIELFLILGILIIKYWYFIAFVLVLGAIGDMTVKNERKKPMKKRNHYTNYVDNSKKYYENY